MSQDNTLVSDAPNKNSPSKDFLERALVPDERAFLQRFARVIAARSDVLRIITPSNESYEASWTETPACSFAVYLANDSMFKTVALDFDGVRSQNDAESAAWLLQQSGFRFARCQSGRQGNEHILATFWDPIPAQRLKAVSEGLVRRFPSLDRRCLVNPTTACLRPPFALHRLGGQSLPLGDPSDALVALEQGNDPTLLDVLAETLGVSLVSAKIDWLLRRGDTSGKYGRNGITDRSRMLQGVALGYVNAGMTEEDFVRDALNPENRGGARLQEELRLRGLTKAQAYANRTWNKAREYHEKHPPIHNSLGAQSRIALMHERVQTHVWRGKAGHTDRAVILAHLAVAKDLGRIVYDLDCRTGGELAGVSRSTFSDSSRRLVQVGWLSQVVVNWKSKQASRWTLTIPCPDIHPHTPYESDLCVRETSDLWRWKGLGKVKQDVWLLLGENVRSEDELCKHLGTKKTTVRSHLRVLASYGLAEAEGAGWVRGKQHPDAVAKALDVFGEGERQRAHHQVQREMRDIYLEDAAKPVIGRRFQGVRRRRRGFSG